MLETQQVFASCVLGVPAYTMTQLLKNIQSIATFGKKQVVSCCVLENTIPADTVGCVRRCTLQLPKYEEALLREKLASVHEEPGRRTVVTLEYVPCGEGERQRAPLSLEAQDRLKRARTTYTVSTITNHISRSFVEVCSEFELQRNFRNDPAAEKALIASIVQFWQCYVNEVLLALEAHVLSEAYPLMHTRLDQCFRTAYEEAENVFCEWSAASAEALPRAEVVAQTTKMLAGWQAVLQEYRQQRLVTIAMQADADGARRIAAEAARQLAASHEEMDRLQREQKDGRPAAAAAPPTSATKTAETNQGDRTGEEPPALAPHELLYQKLFATIAYPQENTTAAAAAGKDAGGVAETASTAAAQSVAPPQDKEGKAAGGAAAQDASEAAAAPKYSAQMLSLLFTPQGNFDEAAAAKLFACFDLEQRQYITAEHLKSILLTMDHQGLHEDVDGTHDIQQLYRSAIKDSMTQRYADNELHNTHVPSSIKVEPPYDERLLHEYNTKPRPLKPYEANEPAGPSPGEELSALQKMVVRYEALRQARKEQAMEKLATETLRRFAYRTPGKLHFDEFCLALIHLFKP